MVEMQETAAILHAATTRSLVILDEIGRGTATFDGLSLAWAVAEHLASNDRARPKTIFATHYHELTDLADALPASSTATSPRASTATTSSSCTRSSPGRSDRSYGIQVARLAGLPPAVVAPGRRDSASRSSRTSCSAAAGRASAARRPPTSGSSRCFRPPPRRIPVVERLRQLDVDRLTPIEALNLLAALKREAEA